MKSTVPVGTGARDPPRARPDLAYVSCPEFLKEGSAVEDFLHPDRVVIGADPATSGPATRSPTLYAPLGGADRPHRRRQRRDDQARLQRLPRHEDLASSTRSPTSARRSAPTSPRSPGAWASTTASAPQFLQAGHRLRRLLLPEGRQALKQLAGNSGYHFQLLNAVIEVNELQKRRVIGKLAEAPRLARRQADRAARPRLQARHRRHARGVEPRARGAAAGRGREVRRLRPGRRASAARELLPGVELRRLGAGGARGRRRGGAGHRVARVRRARLGRGGEADGATRCSIDGRNFLDPEARRARPGFTYEGIGRASAAPASERRRSEPDAGADPRRRRGHAAAPADRRRSRSRSLPLVDRPLPRLHARLAARATASTTSSSPAASSPTACARCSATVEPTGCAPLRRGARAARHRRRAQVRRGRMLDERFLVLNGDVLTDLDLTALLAPARASAARGRRSRSTRSTTRPPTASCAATTDGEVTEFLEKPRPGRDRHRRDQRRRLRARARGARPDPAGRGRSRSSARSSRELVGDGLYGLRARGLLDRHRHARALPAGELGHPRGPGRHGHRRASDETGCWSTTGSTRRPRDVAARR